jgi:hypothetical protein
MRIKGVQLSITELTAKRLDVYCSYSETVINPLPGYD